MYPVSGEVIRKALTSERHALTLEVCLSSGRTYGLSDLMTLREGTVNVQEGDVRRTCNMTFINETVTWNMQRVLDDPLACFEPRLYGVPLGRFYIKDEFIDAPGGYQQVRLNLEDKAGLIAQRKTTKPVSYHGRAYEIAIQMMADIRVPVFVQQGVGDSDAWAPFLVALDTDSDLWAAAQEVLKPVGLEMYFDIYGQAVLKQVPKPTQSASFDISNYRLHRQTSKGRVKINHLIYMVENDDTPPFRVDVYDPNPANLAFGDMPYTVRGRGVTDPANALEVATRVFGQLAGRQVSTVFSVTQIPQWEINDVFNVGAEYFVAKNFSYSLQYGRPMYLTSRMGPEV